MPAYPAMFVCLSAALLATAAAFWVVSRRDDLDGRPRVKRRFKQVEPALPVRCRLPAQVAPDRAVGADSTLNTTNV
jgi:hypothetical protein